MANKHEIIAWDSTVTIDCVSKRVGRYQWIQPLIVRAEAGELMVVVSTMAIMETFKIQGETTENADRIIQEFFDRKWIDPVAAGRKVAEVAARTRRDHGIKGIDSIHVATALVTKTDVLLTDDGRNSDKKNTLLPLDGLISLDGRVLRIMTPEKYHHMKVAAANPLFLGAAARQTGMDGDVESGDVYWLWRASKNRQLAARALARSPRSGGRR